MEVKGLELFNKVVDKFVSKWDCSARVGTEFAYFYLTNEISWSLLVIYLIWCKSCKNS